MHFLYFSLLSTWPSSLFTFCFPAHLIPSSSPDPAPGHPSYPSDLPPYIYCPLFHSPGEFPLSHPPCYHLRGRPTFFRFSSFIFFPYRYPSRYLSYFLSLILPLFLFPFFLYFAPRSHLRPYSHLSLSPYTPLICFPYVLTPHLLSFRITYVNVISYGPFFPRAREI